MSKQERIAIVNQIIAEIASRGRRFFQYEGRVAEIYEQSNKLWMRNEFSGKAMCLSIPDYRRPRGWTHGGTLLGLTRDFCEFIQKGGDTNHNNGYGGLYCKHWGYPDEDMEAIQQKARELGYLKPIETYFGKHLAKNQE